MAWLNNLLSHFAVHPVHLFALLFVMALSKSTVLVSSVLPPASVMLIAGISVSQSALHPGLTWLAVVMGDAWLSGELPYWSADGAVAAGHAFYDQTCG
jgi:membrane protein DedA with SNARE-associated domain